MGIFRPQYHVVYDDKFRSIKNYALDGLFAHNTFNTSSWDKLVQGGLERNTNQEDFDSSDQHHHMPDVYVHCITPDEGSCPFL